MDWQARYPLGKKTALTFSYDDGQVYDRQLVELFNRYGLKATFHLNSGMLDCEGYVSASEAAALYEGHEIACHGKRHRYLTHLAAAQLAEELWEDRRALEHITGAPVTGFSYPFGEYSSDTIAALKTLGIEYARTVESTGAFLAEHDFLRWRPSCHHNDAQPLASRFLTPQSYERMKLFYIWGHSFEFVREGGWQAMEQLCQTLAGCGDVWYATNIQVKRYLGAVRALVANADNTVLYNPSAQPVWVKASGTLVEVPAGQTVPLVHD